MGMIARAVETAPTETKSADADYGHLFILNRCYFLL